MAERQSAIPPLKNTLADLDKPESFLLIGPAGAGKTTQLWTMPTPRLAIFTDPNGAMAIRGMPDTQYLEFVDEGGGMRPVDGDATKLKAIETAAFTDGKAPRITLAPPTAWTRFMAFWNEAIKTGFFEQFRGGTVMLDSYTRIESYILDEFMFVRGKASESKEEQGDARRKALKQINSLVGGLTSLGITVIVTAHRRDKTDRGGGIIGYGIEAIGRAQQHLPSSFSHVIYMSHKPGDKTERRYMATTRAGGWVDFARVPDHDVPAEIDITIKDWDNPTQYGLGKYLTETRAKIAKLKVDPSAKT